MKNQPMIMLDGVLNGLAVTPELAIDIGLQLNQKYDELVNFNEHWKGIDIPRLAVVGLGGLGSRVASYLPNYTELKSIPQIHGPDYLGLDTDRSNALHLSNNYMPHQIPLGADDWDDVRSCEGRPKRARKAFQRAFNKPSDLAQQLAEKDVLILLAGLGGGAGTGLTQALAQHARTMGVLCIVMFTLPMATEVISISAKKELRRVIKYADAVITLSPDDACIVHASDHDAHAWVESQLAQSAAFVILSMLRCNNDNDEFAKIKQFFTHAGKVGYEQGSVRLNSPLRRRPIMRFDPQGVPYPVSKVLVRLEVHAGIDFELASEFVSGQIERHFGCPSDSQTILRHEVGTSPSSTIPMHVWWVAN
ncbi:MAG: hypothetical protein ABL868_00755 [Sulfuriferula sp.]